MMKLPEYVQADAKKAALANDLKAIAKAARYTANLSYHSEYSSYVDSGVTVHPRDYDLLFAADEATCKLVSEVVARRNLEFGTFYLDHSSDFRAIENEIFAIQIPIKTGKLKTFLESEAVKNLLSDMDKRESEYLAEHPNMTSELANCVPLTAQDREALRKLPRLLEDQHTLTHANKQSL